MIGNTAYDIACGGIAAVSLRSKEAFALTIYPYYLSPKSKLPLLAGICALLLCANTANLLISMPSYTQYYDYWVTLAASFLLGVVCLFLIRRYTGMVLIPTGVLALIACISPSLVHWTQVALFFLLLMLLVLKMPLWTRILFRIIAVVNTAVGFLAVLVPMVQRISRLTETGHATSDYILSYVIRTLSGDPLCLLSMLLLVFAMRPHILPGWVDEDDRYDRIWE